MNIDLKGKRALVCGGSKGIGFASARLLANAGASVTLLARDKQELEEAIRELWTINDLQSHDYIISDLSDPYSAIHDIANYIEKGNNIDILINNSGGPAPAPLLDEKTEKLLSAFNQHVISAQLITQVVTPHMISNNWGRIINIISISVKTPIVGLGASNTVRGAMASWSKTLAGELASYGITVNNVLPGNIDTQRIEAIFKSESEWSGKPEEEIRTEREQQIPMKRIGKPEEVGSAVLFLASDMASYVTGINLPVDGGCTPCL